MDDVTKSLNVTLAHTLADGHCFLHAVALQLNETLNTRQAYEFLMKAIETERRTKKNHYTNFIDEDSGRLIFWYTNTYMIKYSIMQPGTSSRKLLPMLYKSRLISSVTATMSCGRQ
ncbi:OTU domain [Trinorchestia longiramus]|nr:OTU domain [Trinorchestia longiramus]